MILLIDNYDSFTFNLLHYIQQLGHECRVVRNDELRPDDFDNLSAFDAAVISPGPKTPESAGALMEFISEFHARKPILGICLGHQALGVYFGLKLVKAQQPVHGKTSMINVQQHHAVFNNIPKTFEAMRYHSLVLEAHPKAPFEVTAIAADSNEVMAIQHRLLPLTGFQFHPESVLTPLGLDLMANWFAYALSKKVVL